MRDLHAHCEAFCLMMKRFVIIKEHTRRGDRIIHAHATTRPSNDLAREPMNSFKQQINSPPGGIVPRPCMRTKTVWTARNYATAEWSWQRSGWALAEFICNMDGERIFPIAVFRRLTDSEERR